MKFYAWNEKKNRWLKESRSISFEEIVTAIAKNNVIDDFPHPNQVRYPNQRIKIVKINDYAYSIPYVEDEQKYFFENRLS